MCTDVVVLVVVVVFQKPTAIPSRKKKEVGVSEVGVSEDDLDMVDFAARFTIHAIKILGFQKYCILP